MGKTFAEKIFNGSAGSVVFREPDLVLSHDNSARVRHLFENIKGQDILHPERLLVVLDRKMTGTTDELSHDYNSIHRFMEQQQVERFFDCDKGICHQVLAGYLRSGMLIVGSDSHTCTAGAFNCMAVGVNKTETAVLWKTGKMWFRVPETVKITLTGKLQPGVYAKDLALWIMGMLRGEYVNYQCIEYHGEGVGTLSVADRMTVANVSAEIGVKCSVFPPDDVLADHFGNYAVQGMWADGNAVYSREFQVDLGQVIPLVMAVNSDNMVKSVDECEEIGIQQGLIGACACGRIEDLRVVASLLRGRKIAPGFQLSLVPASRAIYLQAIDEGLIDILFKAGVSILGASCGPCLGSSHMILADTKRFITTTNSNSMSRLSDIGVEKYVASPATIAMTALNGRLCGEVVYASAYPYEEKTVICRTVGTDQHRYEAGIWNYAGFDNIMGEQLLSELQEKSGPEHLLEGLDPVFATSVRPGDIVIAGENFGCGRLVKPSVEALCTAGVRAVVVKSVARNFFRMASNYGLLVVVAPRVVDSYRPGDIVELNPEEGYVMLNQEKYDLPEYDEQFLKMVAGGGIMKMFRE